MARDDDLVFCEAGQVRDAHVEIGIATGDARGRCMRQRRRTPRCDEPPLSAGQRRQSRADGLGQLVEMHVLACGGIHGRAHFGQHQRSADDREGAAGVDDGLDAYRSIHVRRAAPRVLRGFGRRDERRLDAGEGRQTEQRGEVASAAQQIAAAEWMCTHVVLRSVKIV
jgi:hypothetical protein